MVNECVNARKLVIRSIDIQGAGILLGHSSWLLMDNHSSYMIRFEGILGINDAEQFMRCWFLDSLNDFPLYLSRNSQLCYKKFNMLGGWTCIFSTADKHLLLEL